MSTKIRKEMDKKHSELKIIVPIANDVWKSEQEKAFNKLSKKIKVPGFRPGKAPKKELKKYLSTASIWEEAISKLLNVAVKDAAKEITEKEIILDSPTYSVEKVTEDELEITFIYPVFPELKIKEYKKLGVSFKEPTDKEIEEAVKEETNRMLTRGALLVPKEGKEAKVEKLDTIIFDFKGYIDDKAFEGGEAEKFELKIGSNSFIPGFEEQLIGKPLGWEGKIDVVFPENYHRDDFKNKKAKFDIKIHEIKTYDKPKLDDEYVKTLRIKDVDNVKKLNEYLKDLMKKDLIDKSRTKFIDELIIKVIEENEIPTPRTVVLKELQALTKKFEENLKNQGISKKDYYEITGYSDEKVKNELMVEAEKSIKKSMLYSFFAKDLNIKPSEEDIERQYQRIAKLYNIKVEEAKNMIKSEIIEPQIINELVIDTLIVSNNPSVKIEKEKVKIEPKTTEKKETKKE